ncbi:MAG: hypothetical protein LUC93_03080 [Planctomycetaceae bacterium]|nr:hypothetical protein [Planctomycetaceae bacterium]
MNGPSSYLLLCDIRNILRTGFADFPFREPIDDGNPTTSAGEEVYREPRLYIGHLPPKRSDEDQGEDVPFILIKTSGGDVSTGATTSYAVSVDIVFAAFVPGEDPEAGLHDLLNMAERIMGCISSRFLWADGYFRLVFPIKFSQGVGKTDTPYTSGLQANGNYYQGAISTQFTATTLPQIMPDGTIDAHFGDFHG